MTVAGPKEPSTEELQALNWREFRNWLHRNKKAILPIPNCAVIYAGYPHNEVRALLKNLKDKSELRRMYEIIDAVEAQARQYDGQSRLDTINKVLARMKNPLPKLVEATGANIGHAKKFASMLDCADALASDKWALLPPAHQRKVWDMLSKRYVANAEGKVEIWDGATERMKQVNSKFVMIRTELAELAKNPRVDAKTKESVQKMLRRYEDHYESVGKSVAVIVKRLDAGLRKAAR
ncbi:MAG: hypothetical protein ACT4OK_01025 [Gemmobacter sp.]